jgi:hypothetical protein
MSMVVAQAPPAGAAHWRRLAIALWVVLLLAGFSRSLVLPSRGNLAIYAKCTEAGRRWLAGEPLYPREWTWEMFPYSPAVAVFFVPLSALPDTVGIGLWRLGIGLAYLAALHAWMTSCLPGPLSSSHRAILFLLVLPLTAGTMLLGQAGGLVAAAVLASLAAAARGRWNWCALFAVLACLLKAYPVAVAMLLAVCYPRQLALRLVVFGALGLALPFLFQRPAYAAGQYEGWLHLLAHNDRLDWRLDTANRNLSLLFRVWLTPLSPAQHTVLQLLAAAGAALVCLAASRRGWPPRQLLLCLLGLAGCWMTLFGPFVESYTYILVGPTLAWMLFEAVRESRPLPYRALLAASWGIFTAAALAVWFMRTTPLYNLGPHPLAGLLLLAALVWDLGRQFAAPRPAPREAGTPWVLEDGKGHLLS